MLLKQVPEGLNTRLLPLQRTKTHLPLKIRYHQTAILSHILDYTSAVDVSAISRLFYVSFPKVEGPHLKVDLPQD